MKRSVRIFLKCLLVILILLLVLYAFLQTRIFKNILRDLLVKNINKNLEQAYVSIERIDGNIFSHLNILDFKLLKGSESIVNISQIELNYNLWGILKKEIIIDRAKLREGNLKEYFR